MPFCPRCGSQHEGTLGFCASCGQQFTAVPPAHPIPPPASNVNDIVATIIPYRNMPALFAYYCGVFALLGLPAPVAVILGIWGLRKVAENPQAKGKAHAWTGIILGSLFCIIYGIILITAVRLFAEQPGVSSSPCKG